MFFGRGSRYGLLLLFLLLAGVADGAPVEGDPTSVLIRSEAAVGSKVGNYRLIDQEWEVVPLHSFLGRSVILSFMYIDCHGPCQLMNQSLENLRNFFTTPQARETVFLSITIDRENDTPGALKEYGANFTGDFTNWRFASTDEETLQKMVADLGYHYEKNKMGIDHLNRITLISPEGIVVRHFYGMEYEPREVEEAIVAVMEGKSLSSFLTRAITPLTLYCSTYDPVTKTFKVDYGLVTSFLIQYLLIFGTLGFVFRKQVVGWFSFGRGA